MSAPDLPLKTSLSSVRVMVSSFTSGGGWRGRGGEWRVRGEVLKCDVMILCFNDLLISIQ